MIGTDNISQVIGKDVYDQSGSKIGSASEVYLDDESGQPEWVTVRTGLFGTKESFVPLRSADLTGDGVRVSVSKDQVKDAPRVDTDGHLSPQEEQELYRHYGLQTGTTGTTDTTVGTGRHETTTDVTGTAGVDTRPAVGRDTSGPTTDNAMTRSEERLNVGTRTEEVGRARLRKY
ncbi:PRC-barrel domain-containing protein, partial [Geodermatophilus sp. CPCC 206100]|uniref:PRC-barrel domain-containing protein n=1 Tax=Geodermatophilus sp. CPCC 206100 TaxID=3020054 RepID=UPI003AFFC75E